MKLIDGQFVKHKATGRHGIVFTSSNRHSKEVIFEDMTTNEGIFSLKKSEFCKSDMTLLEWLNRNKLLK